MKHKQNTNSGQQNIYQQITAEVIKALEKGDIIWKKPWAAEEMPRNIIEGNYYRGWNPFYLNMVCLVRGYEFPHFLTYKQAEAKGGYIRKGEKGIQIIYWAKKALTDRAIVVANHETGESKVTHPVIMVPKLHTVFNVEQAEGLDLPKSEIMQRSHIEKIATCENVLSTMRDIPTIQHKGSSACYFPALDAIHMPQQNRFFTDEEYYSTLFHELVHATGHPSRLNREGITKDTFFASHLYSKEELVAELGNAYLSGITGIAPKTIDNSAAYIQGWLRKLQNDDKFFLQAATQAQAAADYILGTTYTPAQTEQAISEAA